jgi:glutathione S-transferase
MTEVIFHHYDRSFYAEKVRVALGLKRLSWRSVQISPVMPKPDLVRLTGGYRKTPVMQIGADIYCDTPLILRELERRFAEPSLYPRGETAVADALAWWADKSMFNPAVLITYAHIGPHLPEVFKADRRKFSGRDFDPANIAALQPYCIDQLRGQLAIMDRMLQKNGAFLYGDGATIVDLSAYLFVWFITSNVPLPHPPLDEFPRVQAWAGRIAAFGNGKPTPMSSAEALDVAGRAEPAPVLHLRPNEARDNRPGRKVTVTPDDSGRDPVVGEVIAADAVEIVVRRSDPQLGEIAVHFPRVGFAVSAV